MTEDLTEDPRAALVYARISNDRTGAGLGVERQESDCRALAARLGWSVVGVHRDNDISAYSGKPRPGYRVLLADLEAGKATGVLAWHTDRLHRSPVELEHYITVCEAAGAVTHTVQAGHLDLATPSGRMVARMLGSTARYESEHKSERVLRAALHRAQVGRRNGGPRPFGYGADGVTVREDEAAAVVRATESVLAGASLRSIERDFAAAGLATTLKGQPWGRLSIREMLLRPRNAGLRDHNGDIVGPANWPPIVAEEQWRAVVAILTDPIRRTSPASSGRVKWLGSGLYVCAGCSRPSLRVSTAGRGIPCYRCPGERGTTGHVVRAAGPLDAYVEAVIAERLSRPDAAELLRPAAPEVDLSGLRAEAMAARAHLVDIAAAFGEGELTRVGYQIARGRADARVERAEAAITSATVSSPLVGLADAVDPGAVWAGLDLGRRRAVLDALMTVTVNQVPRGAPPRFDPATVEIKWRTT